MSKKEHTQQRSKVLRGINDRWNRQTNLVQVGHNYVGSKEWSFKFLQKLPFNSLT